MVCNRHPHAYTLALSWGVIAICMHSMCTVMECTRHLHAYTVHYHGVYSPFAYIAHYNTGGRGCYTSCHSRRDPFDHYCKACTTSGVVECYVWGWRIHPIIVRPHKGSGGCNTLHGLFTVWGRNADIFLLDKPFSFPGFVVSLTLYIIKFYNRSQQCTSKSNKCVVLNYIKVVI